MPYVLFIAPCGSDDGAALIHSLVVCGAALIHLLSSSWKDQRSFGSRYAAADGAVLLEGFVGCSLATSMMKTSQR